MRSFKATIILAAFAVLVQTKSIRDLTNAGETVPDPEDDEELDPRVIGGRDALEGEFPFMVSLHYRGRFICSSFLVTPSVLMTAAHCVVFGDEPEDPEDYTGYAGTLKRDGPEQRINFTKIVAHEEYGYSTEYDIALMYLSEPVKLNDNCQTICLPSNNSVYEDTTAQVVGWGVTEKWGYEAAKTLQTATEKVPTYEMCEFTYSILGIPVTRRHVCAGGDKDKGVCFGDSGSPLVMNETKPTAIGIISFGSFRGCAAYRVPAVCTATSMYHDWILENMGEDAKDLCFVEKASQPDTPAEEQKEK